MILSLAPNWFFETSNGTITLPQAGGGFVCSGGAAQGYARIRRHIPEADRFLPTSIYMRAVMTIPSDFYNKQNKYLRLLNTDNFLASLNGVIVGCTDGHELRFGLAIYANQLPVISADYEGIVNLELWKGASKIPTGRHTFELWGNVAAVGLFQFKIDGMTKVSQNLMACPLEVPPVVRVITRMCAGLDGCGQQKSALSVIVHEVEYQ